MSTPLPETIGIDRIPGPKGLPYLGNLLDIDRNSPIEGFVRMAAEYGPIYRLSTPAGTRLMISDPAIVDEICDDTRYDKKIAAGLKSIQSSVAGTGLFSSDTDNPLWHRAHTILMPPFSGHAMRDYMPKMLDLADQLIDKWSRLNPDEDVDVPSDMTSLTLDTIALCGFGYRFNSFYRETPHPFVAAMLRSLSEAQARATKLPIQNRFRIRSQRQQEEDQDFLRDLMLKLIEDRRRRGADADNTDLLGVMLTGTDRNGEGLPDDNIVAQCLTFLVAGHETTSGLLSFAVYFLIKNPEVAERAYAEVAEVLGDTAAPTYEQVHRLAFLKQVLEETLRLWPTAPLFTRAPFEDAVIGGRYAIPAGTPLTVLIPSLHRDRGVWGEDADRWDPDHLAPARVAALPPNAYKPFGTGQRACIGRQFALQEATLVLGMLLQRFEFVDHLDYQLRTRTTLTIKPTDFRIQVRPRAGVRIARAAAPDPASAEATPRATAVLATAAGLPAEARHSTALTVLFGSNLGASEGIATRLAGEGAERGYAVTLGALDDHVADLPTVGAAIVVSSSYNGTPPDNAAEFCRWLQDPGTAADAVSGLRFTVFGCGDTAWASTYQKVPTLIDERLAALGGLRVRERGAGDAGADFDGQYRAWHAGLWADLAAAFDLPVTAVEPALTGPRLSITLTNRQVSNPVVTSYRARPATVVENRELSLVNGSTASRSTRHVEIALPDGASYRAGDHLGVLPRNSMDNIRRVMARFGLDAGQYATIIPNGAAPTHLPIEEPTPLLGVLGSCVELQDVASRADIDTLVGHTGDPDQMAALAALAGDDDASRARYRAEVFVPNRSVLDLLERFPACALPFEVYLDMLAPLRPRYYSISSSPRVSPQVASVTAGVLRSPSRAGEGDFRGVCSTYLAGLPERGTAFVFVREPSIPFRPPDNPHTPMIMVGAGTGLAPFRGFLQERAALKEQGVPVGPSVLFFGCRNPRGDDLYSDELGELEKKGVVTLHTVCSGHPAEGRRYVQQEMTHRADEVWALLRQGAAVFVCGNANTMAPGVRAALVEIRRDRTGSSAEAAQEWLAELRAEARFVEDIWGG